MQSSKTIKIIFSLSILAVLFFLGAILLNSNIEKKEKKLENANSFDYQVPNSLEINKTDLQVGNGDLNLVIYEDYADTFSADFAKIIDQAQVDFPNRLKIAYRFYNTSGSVFSNNLALAIICAKEQGKGLEMRQEVFKEAQDLDNQEEMIKGITERLTLDKNIFDTCMSNVENTILIAGLKEAAEKLAVAGAPTAFLGDEIIVGAKPYDNFTDSNEDEIEGLKQMIERKLN